MGITKFLSNFAETKEKHEKKELKTRYYRTRYNKVKDAVIEYSNHNDYIINNIDDIHGEIFIQTTKFHLIISIIQVNPLESAVDVKVQTYKIFGMNRPQRIIESLFAFLDKKLEFKGVGLHP